MIYPPRHEPESSSETNSDKELMRRILIGIMKSPVPPGEIPVTAMKEWFKKWWLLSLFVVALISIGACLIRWPVHFIGAEFSISIGHALVIAGILIAPVDYYVKRHLVKEASIDIGKYLLGFPLPEEVRSRLVESLDNKIVVYNSQLDYKIIPIDGKPNEIMLEVERTFEAKNVGSSMQSIPLFLRFEKHTLPTVKEFWCMASDGSIKEHELNPSSTDESGMLRFGTNDNIKIKPACDNPKLIYRFGWKFSYKYPCDFAEHYFFQRPTVGLTIRVECPPEYEFFAPTTEIMTDNRWQYTRAFLPGESIGVRWRKKESAQV
jgi:hypothetical protein